MKDVYPLRITSATEVSYGGEVSYQRVTPVLRVPLEQKIAKRLFSDESRVRKSELLHLASVDSSAVNSAGFQGRVHPFAKLHALKV